MATEEREESHADDAQDDARGPDTKGPHRVAWTLLSESVSRFGEIEGLRLGAAFSYYATFAIFPIALLVVTVTGFVIGDDAAARAELLRAVAGSEPSIRDLLGQTLETMHASGSGGISAAVGLLTLLFSAGGGLVELSYVLNKIWRSEADESGLSGTVKEFLYDRLVGMSCVAGIGLLLLASLVSKSILSAFADGTRATSTLLRFAELASTFTSLTLVLAAAFHFIPRARPPFRALLPGAALTAALLLVLETLFASYLSRLTSFSAYGVAGSVLALATWIYLSSQVLFFGATLTRVRHEMVHPSERARRTAPAPG